MDKYKGFLVVDVGMSFNFTEPSDMIKAFGKPESWTTRETHKRLRPELIGLPIFKGLLGPMYGGDGYLARYETQAAYDRLSA